MHLKNTLNSDATLSLEIGGTTQPKDTLLIILYFLEMELRSSHPKQWDALKLVCSTFNKLIWLIEDNDKWLFYNDVSYPVDKIAIENEVFDQTRDATLDRRFLISTPTKLISVRQLGRQCTHYWAPVLTCDDKFLLRLYNLQPGNEALVSVCEYNLHQAKLTAAISVGKHIVSADEKGFVGIWSPNNKASVPFQAHNSRVNAIDYLTSQRFVTGATKEVKFWNIEQTEAIKTLTCDGVVKALWAKSLDVIWVLTMPKNQTMKLTHYQNDEPISVIEFQWDETIYSFNKCEEFHIVSPSKIVGVRHGICDIAFGSVDFSDPAQAVTQKIYSRPSTAPGYLSRGHFCMFTTHAGNQRQRIIFSLETSSHNKY